MNFEGKLSDEAYLAKLSEIRHSEKDVIAAPYFKTKDQDKIGLSNFFYVKLKELNDTILLRREAEKEHAFIAYQSNVHLWFVLSVSKKSRYNAMELANHFYELESFQYTEPDLLIDDVIDCANDSHFGLQWGLKNIGQSGGTSGIDIKICDAWQVATGSNITVAVVDHGINLSHPDKELQV